MNRLINTYQAKNKPLDSFLMLVFLLPLTQNLEKTYSGCDSLVYIGKEANILRQPLDAIGTQVFINEKDQAEKLSFNSCKGKEKKS